MEFDTYQLRDLETGQQIFGEFMSAEYAWNYVVCNDICRIDWTLADLS